MRSPRRPADGFTLIELIVSILILGVLAAIAVLGYGAYTARAQQVVTQSNIRAVTTAALSQAVSEQETYVSREQVRTLLGAAADAPVIDATNAATLELGRADQSPTSGQYAVGFDNEGTVGDEGGQRAALLGNAHGTTYGQILNLHQGQSSQLGAVPDGTTPELLLANPDLIGTTTPAGEDGTPGPDPSTDPEDAPTDDPEGIPDAAAPTDVTATASGTGASVTWAPVPDAQGYRVTASAAGLEDVTCSTTATSCTLPALAPGVPYQVLVEATNADGRTATSTAVPLEVPPAAPVVTAAAGASGKARATWPAVPGAVKYNVDYKVGTAARTTASISTTQFETSIAAGVSMNVRVQAVSATGALSAWSSSVDYTRPLDAPVPVAVPFGVRDVKVTWPASGGATSYQMSYRIDGGPLTTLPASTTRSATVVVPQGSTFSAEVVGTNGTLTSSAGTTTLTTALWADMALVNSWAPYSSTSFQAPGYTRTADDVVVLQGLIQGGAATSGNVITTLPVGFRPESDMVFQQPVAGVGVARIDVMKSGVVRFLTTSTGGSNWTSLSGITFIPAGSKHTATPLTLSNGWQNYNPTTATAKSYLDGNGRTHVSGLVSNGTTGDNTLIATLPAAHASDTYLHLPAMSNYVFANVGINARRIEAKPTTNDLWQSLEVMFYSASKSSSWSSLTLQNGWSRYGTGFPSAQRIKGSDNIVTLRGLIKGGSTAVDSVVATLPVGSRPAATVVMQVSTNSGYGRVDVRANGDVVVREVFSNGYLSLDGISFVAEK